MNCSKKLATSIVGVLMFVLPMAPRVALAETKRESGPARMLFDSANRERAARRLPLLQWDEALSKAARQHAARMAEKNTLSHQLPGELDLSTRVRLTGSRFVVLAENVAMGPSAADLHVQWMNSPHHRENLLDPQLNSLGVAVAERGGQLFAVQDFSQAVADLSLREQEKQVGVQLKIRGLKLIRDDEDARKVCEKEHGHDLDNRSAFLLRYSTADIDQLPNVLIRELRGGHYRTAGLAACSPDRQTDFSTYHLAVLLYE